MRRLPIVVTLLSAAVAVGQEKPPYQVPEPKGWTRESIDLPPKGFAPDMKWKGKEEIRFAPGMFNASDPGYFSYAFLFWLPEGQKTDPKTMTAELLTYYRGLAKTILAYKKPAVDVASFTLTIAEAKEKPGKRATGEAVAAYTGELKWVEPFVTRKAQTLQFDIQVWQNAKHKHHCVFVCVSPQPVTAEVWKNLREIRQGTTFP